MSVGAVQKSTSDDIGTRQSNGTSTTAKPATESTESKQSTQSSQHKNMTTKVDPSKFSNSNKIRMLYFFYRFSTGSMVPFMSLYMQHIGLDTNQIGSLQAIRPIVTLVSGPFWGGLADRSGKKKMVLILLYIGSVLGRLSIQFIDGSIHAFAVALCISSMFYSACPSLIDSIVVSSMPEKDKANFGKMRLWGELGNGVASTIMMRLINDDRFGFKYLFLVHGFASAIALIFLIYSIPEDTTTPKSTTHKDSTKQQLKDTKHTITWKDGLLVMLSDIQILSLFSLIIVTGFSMGFLENFCYINIRQLYKAHGKTDVVGRDVSLCRVFFSLGGVLTWWCSGSWTKRFGSDMVMVAAVCCLPFCFFLYSGIGSDFTGWTTAGIWIAESVRSGIYAALWSTATVRMNKLSPSHMKSIMQTMMESTYRGIGHTSGSFVGGIMCKKYDDISVAFTAAGKGLLSFLCIVGTIGFARAPKQLKCDQRRLVRLD